MMEMPSHRSKEEVLSLSQAALDNAIDSIDLSRSLLSSSVRSGLLKNLDLLVPDEPAQLNKEMSASYKILKERLDLKVDTNINQMWSAEPNLNGNKGNPNSINMQS